LLQASVTIDARALHEDAQSSGSEPIIELQVARTDDEQQQERLARLMPIAWVHVPKTGSSFANTLFAHPGICPSFPQGALPIPGHGFFPWVNEEIDLNAVCPGAFSDTHQFHGHNPIGDIYNEQIGHGLIMLRQPEQRIISHYNMAMDYDYLDPRPSLREYAEEVQGYSVKMLTRGGTWGDENGYPIPGQVYATPQDVHRCEYCQGAAT